MVQELIQHGQLADVSNSVDTKQYAHMPLNPFDFGDFDGEEKTDLICLNYLNAMMPMCLVYKSDGFTFFADIKTMRVPLMLNGMRPIFQLLM